MELSGEIPVKLLCKTMGIQRSSFYAWKKHLSQPSGKEKRLLSNVLLFQEYHWKYPSHGYRWLNAKIRLDKEIVLSDPYAHKCCRIAGISTTGTRRLAIQRGYFPTCSCLKCRSMGQCSAS